MFERKEIGKKLRRLRLEKFGNHIRAFERQSGVSRGSIPRIESGDSFPMLDALAKWLGACRVTFAHFFEEFEELKEPIVPEAGYQHTHKRYHDELEFVLKVVSPSESATVRTLQLEYEKLRDSQTRPPENPGRKSKANAREQG